MLRVFTDFNARSEDGTCWDLIYQDRPVDEKIVKTGDVIILFQDEEDFEVMATVDYRFVKELGQDHWVATPDWLTKQVASRHQALISSGAESGV